MCIDGEEVEFSCPDGLNFNPTAHVCDTPQNAQCTSGETTESGVTEGTTENPTSAETTEQPTSSRTTENPTSRETTEQPSSSGTTENHTSRQTTEQPTSSGTSENPTSSDSTETTSGGIDFECESSGIHFHAHPTECTKYIECVEGFPYEFTCPNGLHFNPVAEACDYPESAGCKATSSGHFGGETKTSVESTTNDDGRPPVTNDPICPDNGIVFLPNPENCTSFFECVEGNKYTFTCPAGLHFNPSLSICDYPTNAGCQAPASGHFGAKDENENTGKPPIVNDPDCQVEGVYFLVDKENCSIYYECVDGNKFEFICPAGLYFNLEKETCDFPKNVDCPANDK